MNDDDRIWERISQLSRRVADDDARDLIRQVRKLVFYSSADGQQELTTICRCFVSTPVRDFQLQRSRNINSSSPFIRMSTAKLLSTVCRMTSGNV